MSEQQELSREDFASLIDDKVDEFFDRISVVADLERANTVGEWSIRDMLAHVVAWHEECLWAIRSTQQGSYERRDYSNVDAWNAGAVAKLAGLSGADLLEKARVTGHEIARMVGAIPDELWEAKRRLYTWPYASTIRHYEEHESDVRSAMKGPR